MEKKRDFLVFVYNLSCPLECDYCCHDREILGDAKFDPHCTVGVIEEAVSLGTVKRFVFTGGEPFIFYHEIKEILREVYSLGLPVRIVTSAYWAESEEKGKSMLSPLFSLGVDEISITTDPSHQKFVPMERVKYAAHAAIWMGMNVEIASTFWKTGMDIRPVLNLPDSDSISYSQALVLPMGRARNHRVGWMEYGQEYPPSMSGGCAKRERRMDITIYPDGGVYPCCSGGFNIEAGLKAGNVYGEPLKVIVDRMWANPFIRVMRGGGPEMIYELCRFKYPELHRMLPRDDDLCSVCQICVKLNSNSHIRESLIPILKHGVKILDCADKLRREGAIRHEGNRSGLAS